ncbi:MAG: hypothetical protein ACE145_07695 [Terriglobia bacterium]
MATRQKEVIRGKILYYLALVYPEPVTLPLLQAELDLFGYPVPFDELNFHLAYLAEKGLVSLENAGLAEPRPPRRVTLVKITARGIDYFDGRLPAEEGVYLEPRS